MEILESSLASEWNSNPSLVALSAAAYGDALKGWIERADAPLGLVTRRGCGGRMQPRATRLFIKSVPRTSMIIRE